MDYKSYESFKDFSHSSLTAPFLIGETSLEVVSGELFPEQNFYIVINNENISREICFVRERDGNTLHLQTLDGRANKGTLQSDHAAGSSVVHTILAHHVEEAIKGNNIFLPGRPQGNLVREYNFDSTVEGWVADSGSSVSSVGGKLRHTYVSSVSSANEPSGVSSVSDGEVCFSVTNVGGNDKEGGFIFRAVDGNNYYLFQMRASGSSDPTFELFKCVSGSFTSISSSSTKQPALDLGVTFRVMIRFVGSIIDIYINDTVVMSANDSAHSSGRFGTRIGDSSTFDYEYIEIYELAPDWKPSWAGGKYIKPVNTDHEWKVDAKPIDPSPYDEEFDELPSNDWHIVNDQSGLHFTRDSKLVVRSIGNGASWNPFLYGRELPYSSGDNWSITAKVDISFNPPLNNAFAGMFLHNAANNRLLTFGYGLSNPNRYMRVYRWNNLTSPATALFNRADTNAYRYYRMRKLSNDLYLDVSFDGVEWENIIIEPIASHLLAVTNFGFFSDHNTATTSYFTDTVVEFVRLNNNGSKDQRPTGSEVYYDRVNTIGNSGGLLYLFNGGWK